jgi:hypothetical protein
MRTWEDGLERNGWEMWYDEAQKCFMGTKSQKGYQIPIDLRREKTLSFVGIRYVLITREDKVSPYM